MIKLILLLIPLIFMVQCSGDESSVNRIEFVEKIESEFINGHLDRYLLKPDNLPERYVDVWIPESMNTETEHSVLYMHDGQMLFDETSTWNGQEWRVDETLSRLMGSDEIQPTIVVGVWNADEERRAEYFPEDALPYINGNEKAELVEGFPNGPQANRYMKAIAETVIPFVEEKYTVKRNRSGRFIAGSSYGGLISVYTLTKYPDLFSGAAALSTHWPGIFEANDEIPDGIMEYLVENLPEPGSHKIYFDHGTETLDSLYAPYQQKIDEMLLDLGYTSGRDFTSKVFDGTDHSENAWADRFEVPVRYLLHH